MHDPSSDEEEIVSAEAIMKIRECVNVECNDYVFVPVNFNNNLWASRVVFGDQDV